MRLGKVVGIGVLSEGRFGFVGAAVGGAVGVADAVVVAEVARVDGGAAFGFGFVAGLLFSFLPAFFDLPAFPAGFAGGVAVWVP